MKQTKRSLGCWAAAALMLLLGVTVALTGCVNHEYDFSSTVIHTDPLTTRPKADFSKLAGIYKSEFTMTEAIKDDILGKTSATKLNMYLMITEDGSFAFSDKLEFDNAAYGAGSLGLYLDKEPVFIYFALSNKSVTTGSRVSRYEVGKDGEITFLSTMWYGGRAPSTETDEGTVYPTFVPYKEPEAKDLTMGPAPAEVISSVRAQTTTRAATTATTTGESSTTDTTTAASTTARKATTANRTTNSLVKYTYNYNTGKAARPAYTYTMPNTDGKSKNGKTTRAATTAAPRTTEEETEEPETTVETTEETAEETTTAAQ